MVDSSGLIFALRQIVKEAAHTSMELCMVHRLCHTLLIVDLQTFWASMELCVVHHLCVTRLQPF